ncbi:hypothetical protein ACHQM5_000272 [Ranunculus cassubicifolius]
MAYRRSLSTTVNLLTRRRNPSLGYVLHDDEKKRQPRAADSSVPRSSSILLHGYHNFSVNKATTGLGALFRERGLSVMSQPIGLGSSICSYSSSATEKGSDSVQHVSDVAETLLDNTLESAASQASAVSEVAAAAADSYFPIAALQYFIDGIHTYTGLNWWASIAVATLVIRGLTIPLLINQLRCTTKLTLIRPQMEEIRRDMEGHPDAFNEGNKRIKALFKEYGVSPFSPLKGLFVQGPVFVSFYLAISNMAEKVPSFKEGGAYWFTDLTTPDPLFIFPILTGLTFLITVECNVQEGLEGNPVAGKIKKFSRIVGVLAIPATYTFPKALFCYWVTSNIFSLTYGSIIKLPGVKKRLNIPVIPEALTKRL